MPTAVLCDDEPLMRDALREQLRWFWPELQVVGEASDGAQALRLIQDTAPAIAFLDIHMPGLSGMQVAKLVADRTQVVFVTAHAQYALQAFEAHAVDYLLKPIDAARLAGLVARLKRVASPSPLAPMDAAQLDALLQRMQGMQAVKPAALTWLQVAVGSQIRMVHVDDVMYFESDSKYTRVLADDCDGLIRLSLKELLLSAPANAFLQVHRGVVVNRRFIRSVIRRGEVMELELKGRPERLRVSESNQALFKAM